MNNYQQQYCQKHDQYFADFLARCPICIGETLKPAVRPLNAPKPAIKPVSKPKTKLVKRKKEHKTPSLFDF